MTTPSVRALEAITAPETAEDFIWLLTMEHQGLTAPIRLARNWRRITSRGQDFIPFPFRPTVVQDEKDRPPRLTIQIGNVSRTITAQLETLDGAPKITLEVVLASKPSVVEYALTDFEMRRTSYDKTVIQSDLVIEDFFSAPYPDLRYTPVIAPGAHRS